MADVQEMLMESWDKQAQIMTNLASLVTEENKGLKPSDDGMDLEMQLAHVHSTRRYWLSQFSPEHLEMSSPVREWTGDGWKMIADLEEVKKQLALSAKQVSAAVSDHLKPGAEPGGQYENPVMYLQHMVWHEGWHAGLIMLGLRLGGLEPAEEWEDPKIWQLWRGEEKWED